MTLEELSQSNGAGRKGSDAVARPAGRIAAQRAAADPLTALGADLDRDGLRETSRRMVDACLEFLSLTGRSER